MKKLGYVILALVIAFIIFAVIVNNSAPSAGDAISFVEKGVKNELKNPDSAEFDSVNFYPDSSPQGDEISGAVCGYVNGQNSFNAYTGRARFFSRITVSNNGRSADYSAPTIENPDNPISKSGMDSVWQESCQ